MQNLISGTRKRMRYLWRILLAVLLLGAVCSIVSAAWHWSRPNLLHDPFADSPRVFLWAWERPENLSFLDPKQAGVAILAKTLILNRTHILVLPRLQPIDLPRGITTIAVVRIESDSGIPNEEVRSEVVRQILDLASRSAIGIQIDFDARVSERGFYRAILTEVRRQLPPDKKLSITALASWCIYNDWIEDLPVDESVPMLFRMGTGAAEVACYLASDQDFRPARARFSIGISMDELPKKAPEGRRIYIFNPQPWTRESADRALRYAREMQ
jgi:hypothetical protein